MKINNNSSLETDVDQAENISTNNNHPANLSPEEIQEIVGVFAILMHWRDQEKASRTVLEPEKSGNSNQSGGERDSQ